MEPKAVLGIIGGSDLYGLRGVENQKSFDLTTPFGAPSSPLKTGEVAGVPVAFLSRHGAGHVLSPSEVPYAANVYAMKLAGVQKLVSISAVGSLREELPPRSFVVPDGIVDRTVGRRRTFFGQGMVAHVSLADPFCGTLSDVVRDAAREGSLPVSSGGAYVCIEGPQFSTKAESRLYRSWGASIIGMTAMPEARLAREAEMCYACLAMVTDYDVWHETEEHVSVDAVVANLTAMTGEVHSIIGRLADASEIVCEHGCQSALAGSIITAPEAVHPDARERLRAIAGKYLAGQDDGR